MDKDMARKIAKEHNDYSVIEDYTPGMFSSEKTTAVSVPSIEDQMDLKREHNLEHADFGFSYVVY